MATSGKSILAVKSVTFGCAAPAAVSSLLEEFRSMCNKAIELAVQANPKNRFKLLEIAYPSLKQFGLHTHYILSACEVAFSVFRNRRRKSIPLIRKAFLKLDNQSYQLNHLLLRVPTTARHFLYLTLSGSDYHQAFLDNPDLKRGSVTISQGKVSIAFTKQAKPFEPVGSIGVDVNEKNATASASNGWGCSFDQLAKVVEIQERYREIRAGISKETRGDRRIAKRILSKYGRREIGRTRPLVHQVTRRLVTYACEQRMAIKIERLKGIRKLYRTGKRTASLRARMNTWVFGETQRQIDYKSKWEGVPCLSVNPRGTSSNCPDCGSRVAPLPGRKLYCAKCDNTWDRDILASRNIMACVVPQARPSKRSSDGEGRNVDSDPLSRWMEGNGAREGPRLVPEPG